MECSVINKSEYTPQRMTLFVRCIRPRRDRRSVLALRIVAVLDVTFALRLFLQKVRRRALRAGPRHGAVVQREVAFRVARAGKEDPTPRAALDQLSLFAIRTRHAGRFRRRALAAADLADGLAVGVAGAGEERAVAAGLEHHLLAAILTGRLRLGWDVSFNHPRIRGVLTVGIAGTGIELTEARPLELHRLAA